MWDLFRENLIMRGFWVVGGGLVVFWGRGDFRSKVVKENFRERGWIEKEY